MLHDLIQFIRDPGTAITTGGYVALALIVFLETGALVFFLPGDSLLVTAGLYAVRDTLNIWLLLAVLLPAAILGPMVSYWIGAKVGPRLFNKPRSRFFRPEHIQTAHQFYEKHGAAALIIARFMPIVRTFVPVVAGIGKMDYARYTMLNLVGAAAWILSLTLTGYFLGAAFPDVVNHIEVVIVAVVVLSMVPIVVAWWRRRKASQAGAAPAAK
jgi:membrane-associated protein